MTAASRSRANSRVRTIVFFSLAAFFYGLSILHQRSLFAATFEEAIERLGPLSGAGRLAMLEREAEKEGRVRWSSSSQRVEAVVSGFKRKYPKVQLEFQRMSGRALAERLIQEYRAEKYDVDVVGSSAVTFLGLKEAGIIRPYFSPQAASLKKGMKDPDGFWTGHFGNVFIILCNRHKAKQAPDDWRAFVDPRWKADFSIDNERVEWFHALRRIYGDPQVKELFSGLVRNRVLIRRGGTLQAQLVAAGEFSCQMGARLEHAYMLGVRGAPITYSVPKPVLLSPSINMMARYPPHPYAAMLFFDFLISDEALTLLTRGTARVPPKDGLPVVPEVQRLDEASTYFVGVEDQSRHYNESKEMYESLITRK